MRYFAGVVTSIALIAFASFSKAQTVTKGDLNTWFLVVNRLNVSEKFTVTNELHERTGSFLSNHGTIIVRPSVDYHLYKGIELSLGYTFSRTWPYAPYSQPIPRSEHNVWEQVMTKSTIGKVTVQNRFRFEQRWIGTIKNVYSSTGPEYYIDGSTYANRFRYRFIVSFDILKVNNGKNSLFFSGFDEIWINQSNNFMPNTFARNWLYTGLGFKFNHDCNVQLAHMHQYDKTGANSFISSSIIQLSVFKNFTLYGKKPN